MGGKDGKHDPQDAPAPALFPTDTGERQRIYQRVAENFIRIEYLRHKLIDDGKPLREEIDTLTRLNRALLKEIRP